MPEPPHTLRRSRPGDIVLWLLRRRQRFRVTGTSMLPLLKPGEEVLMAPRRYGVRSPLSIGAQPPPYPQPGEIVVALHPEKPALKLIKWVVWVEADGRCYLKGLNMEASTDSRSFGLVASSYLLGRVVCRFP